MIGLWNATRWAVRVRYSHREGRVAGLGLTAMYTHFLTDLDAGQNVATVSRGVESLAWSGMGHVRYLHTRLTNKHLARRGDGDRMVRRYQKAIGE